MQLDATLSWEQQSLQLSALVDSGADENFLDSNLVSQAGIPVEVLPAPLNAHALNGELLARVSHRTIPLSLHLSGNHTETIQFYIISSSHAPVILGQPWLRQHNPHFDWTSGSVVSWSSYCHSTCLQSARSPVGLAVSPPASEPPDLTSVPLVYHDVGEVFGKRRALSASP
ncbi:hypothetical protein DPEC_G00044780 [Dallia pectoralis]|uniref:Uncharacterized protein n=1 Tax=Dallia pectoralis TaxID=75939 RepID=A0ACC2H9S5_DALPE|nr:hypothetical protein DPEC_G00044780 [Dallia pectoralis]